MEDEIILKIRASLVTQWLRLHTSTAGGIDSIPGKGTKIAAWQKKNNDK